MMQHRPSLKAIEYVADTHQPATYRVLGVLVGGVIVGLVGCRGRPRRLEHGEERKGVGEMHAWPGGGAGAKGPEWCERMDG